MMRMNVKTAMKIVIFLIWSILLLQSCASSPTSRTKPSTEFAAVASREQKTADDGTITSRKKHIVSLSPYSELGSGSIQFDLAKYKSLFMLFVENCGKEPISIGVDDISVIFEASSKDLASKKISIQSFDDFMKDFEKLYNDSEKVYIYNKLYHLYLISRSSPPINQINLEWFDLKENIMTGRTEMDAIQTILPEYALEQKTILEPGNSYSGMVIGDTQDLDPQIEGRFQIIVSLDGEEYDFTFNRSITK